MTMKQLIILVAVTIPLYACNNSSDKKMTSDNKESATNCLDECKAKNNSTAMVCKLTTPELQKRKATVLASLKSQITEKKELTNGFAFKFPGNDLVLDELTEFIKTERACCDFFTFGLSVSGDKSAIWLQITGEDGAKDFISIELGL
jgi:hypothetical protein